MGVQIGDGDLFKFDDDVMPLLTVLVGKILEQSDLEIREEEEIKRIRDAKADFLKRIREDRARIKKIEEEEIKLKKDMDNKKGLKLIEKSFRKNTQKKLVSKVFSKCFLKNLEKNSTDVLIKQGIFLNQDIPFIKNDINDFVFTKSENNNIMDNKLVEFNFDLTKNLNEMQTKKHKEVIIERKKYLQQMKIDEENRIKVIKYLLIFYLLFFRKKKNVKKEKKLRGQKDVDFTKSRISGILLRRIF